MTRFYTERLGTDKDDALGGRETKANTALVKALVLKRHKNKAAFYLAWGSTQKKPELQCGEF